MKTPILKSTPLAWCAMLLVVIVLICTYTLRPQWWAFIDIFFFFLMAFAHAVACSLARISPQGSQKLDLVALVCGIIAVLAFIGEWIAYAVVGMP